MTGKCLDQKQSALLWSFKESGPVYSLCHSFKQDSHLFSAPHHTSTVVPVLKLSLLWNSQCWVVNTVYVGDRDHVLLVVKATGDTTKLKEESPFHVLSSPCSCLVQYLDSCEQQYVVLWNWLHWLLWNTGNISFKKTTFRYYPFFIY